MGEPTGVVGTLPKTLQTKGRQLLSRLSPVAWNERGELMHEGVAIPGSKAVDLVHDLLGKRKTPDPVGWQQFTNQMRAANIPMELVGNVTRRRYTRRRAENGFQPQQAQPYGQMAIQWLTWESDRTGCAIRHQANGREKRFGKLSVDGWCAQTRTAYQFNGCFWHGCPKCNRPEEINVVNGKTMAVLLADTKTNTAYLRRHVKVIVLWECAWKRERDPPRRPKWTMTQQQIITAVVDGTLFGMVECDIPCAFRAPRSFRRDATHL